MQKVIASVAVVGVVTGSTLGLTNVIGNNKKDETEKAPDTSYVDSMNEPVEEIPEETTSEPQNDTPKIKNVNFADNAAKNNKKD